MFKRKKKKQQVEEIKETEVAVEKDSNMDKDIADIIDFGDFDPNQEPKVIEEETPTILEQDEEEITDPIDIELVEEDSNEEEKDLSAFFEESKEEVKEDLKKEKEPKKKKKPKKKSRRQRKKERDLQDIKDRKLFKYKNRKFTKVEDFIKYLNAHYLDIDEIAKEVLDDEHFYGWVSKNSGIFEQSLNEFKNIKEKIEK